MIGQSGHVAQRDWLRGQYGKGQRAQYGNAYFKF